MKLEAAPLVPPSSLEELAVFAQKTRAALRDILGAPPFAESPPLKPQVIYTADEGSYWRRKVRYGNESDDVVWAWLLEPKGIGAPTPAVICLPGSFMTPNWGKDGPAGLAGPLEAGDPEAYGADLARLGYIALCPDYPCAGERTTPGLKSHDTAELDRRFPSWTRVGMSAWDVSRGVDFLLTLAEVDAQRIGCTGWSQGGQMSLLGAALDERIAAVVPVCGWSPLRGLEERLVDNLTQSYNYPRLRPYAEEGLRLPIDLEHVAALIAPRPFLDLRAAEDPYFPNRREIDQAAASVEAVYKLHNAGECFKTCWFSGGHAHGSAAARESQAWFYRWLWKVD